MIASVGVLAAVVMAGVVGAAALYRSTDGSDAAAPDRPERTFPETPNLLLGVTDENGELASVAVFTRAPGGEGGSVVSVPTNAALIVDGQRVGLASQFDGSEESLRESAVALLGVAFDDVVIRGETTLPELLPAVDSVEVDLPADVVDDFGVSGRIIAELGVHTMTMQEAAAVLAATAGSPVSGATGPRADENDVAVWTAIADAVGDGAALAGAGETGAVLQTIYAGGVQARGLDRSTDSDDGDLVALNRSDVLLVFGQISPRQVAAPAASVNVRLVARFPDGRIDGGAISEVASRAIDRLLMAQANVVSVATGEGDAPAETHVEVVTRGADRLARDIGPQLFGDTTVDTADYDLRGVDLVITLGESFLRELETTGQTGG
jgi:hypothetical protein